MRKFSYTYKICHAYYYNTTAVMQNNIYQNVVLLVYGFKLYQGDLLSSKSTLINIGIKNFNHHMLYM